MAVSFDCISGLKAMQLLHNSQNPIHLADFLYVSYRGLEIPILNYFH